MYEPDFILFGMASGGMSLVLMFIYWVAIPIFALYAGRGLLHRARTPLTRGLLKFIGTALFLGWYWLTLGKQLHSFKGSFKGGQLRISF